MGAGLNAVEVSDPETFLANGNKPAEFFTSLYCGERLRGMGCKGEQQWRAEAQRKSLPLWRMEDGFLRSSGLGSDLCRRYRWSWINAGSTMTPRAPATGSAA